MDLIREGYCACPGDNRLQGDYVVAEELLVRYRKQSRQQMTVV